VDSVQDLLELEDDKRDELLKLTAVQMTDVAIACNNWPDIDVSYEVVDKDDIHAGGHICMKVSLEREVRTHTYTYIEVIYLTFAHVHMH